MMSGRGINGKENGKDVIYEKAVMRSEDKKLYS